MSPAFPVATRTVGALLVLSVVALASCSASTPAATDTPPPSTAAVIPSTAVESPSKAPPASPSAPEASASLATAVPTAIDPCQLITGEEAGKLVGATFGAGKESTTEGNARICTYGGGTNIFSVIVAQAPDEATAKAAEQAAQADLKAAAGQLGNGLTVTQLPSFAPGADAALLEGTASVAGNTVGARGMYVLHGTTFFGFSDVALGSAPPSADAMKSEAMTVLGRLP